MSTLSPVLKTDFNPLLVESFLIGSYHVLVAQAVWKVWRRSASKIYAFSLVLLWALCTLQMICGWIDSREAFVVDLSSEDNADLRYPIIMQSTAMIASFLISDGIVIWRSHVLMGKYWASTILVTLILVSAACNTAFVIMPTGSPTGMILTAVALAISAITTIIATMIIALKIIAATRASYMRYSYTRIIDIIIQSAALESMLLIVEAVVCFLTFRWTQNSSHPGLLAVFMKIDAYLYSFRVVVVGVAPTLIALRAVEKTSELEVDEHADTQG